MRIALLHSFYASDSSSGENVVVDAQFQALSAAGHEVLLLGRRTDDEVQLPGYRRRAAWQTLTSRGPDPSPRLRAFAPDVVHVHNTVPNIGLSWLGDWSGPIVHTLHNYRPLCANGLLFRDGRLCTDCPDGRPWSALEHACYRDSRVATLPIAGRNATGVDHNRLLQRADALVVLSEFARDTFVRYGVDERRLRLIPNGVTDLTGSARPAPATQRWLAVGRLRAEKGFAELLRSWPANVPLDIAGDGPQRAELEQLAGPEVALLGEVPAATLRERLPDYTGLVFTGLAPESATPLVVVEALEAGVPVAVVSSSPHARALIADGVAMGFDARDGLVDPDGLRAAMVWVRTGGDDLRRRVREVFEQRFTQTLWLAALIGLYREVGAP